MSLVTLVPTIQKTQVGTEVDIALVVITLVVAGLVVACLGTLTFFTCAWHSKCCKRGRAQVKQVKAPSGLSISYGGPSAR